MTTRDVLMALEAQQLIQQRNPPTSAKWREASENIHQLVRLLPPPCAGEFCALCRRSVDRESEDLEFFADGSILHKHCAADLRADGQL